MKQNIDQIRRPIMLFQCDHPKCKAEALAYLYPAGWEMVGHQGTDAGIKEQWYCPEHRPVKPPLTIPGVEMVVLESKSPEYEYRVAKQPKPDRVEEMEDPDIYFIHWLNDMGASRWELVEKIKGAFIFKRAKQEG